MTVTEVSSTRSLKKKKYVSKYDSWHFLTVVFLDLTFIPYTCSGFTSRCAVEDLRNSGRVQCLQAAISQKPQDLLALADLLIVKHVTPQYTLRSEIAV